MPNDETIKKLIETADEILKNHPQVIAEEQKHIEERFPDFNQPNNCNSEPYKIPYKGDKE